MKKWILIALTAAVCLLTACDVVTYDTSSAPPATAPPQSSQTTTVVSPSETEPPETEPPVQEAEWKKLYLDFLDTLDDSAFDGYQLIYIDNDEIPELAAHGVTHIAQSYLCWVNGGELVKGDMSFSGFAYFEKQNCYLCEEGFTGMGRDYVRKINGAAAEDLHKGEFSTIKGQEYYRWDGTEYADYDAYSSAKAEVFDKNSAQKADNLKTMEQIRQQIKDF